MKKYKKDINIGTIVENNDLLGPSFYQDNWVDFTDAENYEESLIRGRVKPLSELDKIKSLEQVANFSYTNSNGTYELRNSEKSKNKIVGRNQVWREGVTSKVWISASGEAIQFTKEDYDNIIDIIESKEEVVYTKEAIIEAQIRAITDYTELESFDVQEAWDNTNVV